MNFDHTYLNRVLAQLSQVAGISHRRIFTGVSLYSRGVQFALVVNDRLYFYTDEHSRPLYQQQGMSAFQPRLATQVQSCFYQVPEHVINQPAELHHWLRIALDSASTIHGDDMGKRENDVDYRQDSSLDNAYIPRQARA